MDHPIGLDSSVRQKSPIRVSNFLAANAGLTSSTTIGKRSSIGKDNRANVAMCTNDKFKAMIDKLMLHSPSKLSKVTNTGVAVAPVIHITT